MGSETMGRVLTPARIENLRDLWDFEQGRLAADQVRRAEVLDALVDTGATTLSLPASLIKQLGLTQTATKRVISAKGSGEAAVYGTVRLTIQDREFVSDVLEVPDGVPVLIGQIPLEYLDFVVDPKGQRLIGNPAHGGEHVLELY
jgi:predicted aspartyl protease